MSQTTKGSQVIITEKMQTVLEELKQKEGDSFSQLSNLSANELGNELIDVYYGSDNQALRQLIHDFLELAGVVWLRKLLTHDTAIVASSKQRLASLDEYLGLLAANDDTVGLIVNGYG